MIYLFLAVLCSSAIGIVFKVSEDRSANRYLITTVNYFTAVLFSGYLLVQSGVLNSGIELSQAPSFKELLLLVWTSQGRLSWAESFGWSILLGIASGWFYFAAFVWYQIAVRKNGIALSGMFSRLGILVPMGISIIAWQEVPTTLQAIGILLCLFSIVLVSLKFQNGERFRINHSLTVLFLTFGIAIFCNKVFQRYAVLELKPLFLFSLFCSAFLVSLSVSLQYAKSLKADEVIIGIAAGVPNLFASWFLIQALDQINASVVFPVFSAGAMVLIAAAAVFLFGERIETKNGVSIAFTVLALVLINL